jgi:hypothetical protein
VNTGVFCLLQTKRERKCEKRTKNEDDHNLEAKKSTKTSLNILDKHNDL